MTITPDVNRAAREHWAQHANALVVAAIIAASTACGPRVVACESVDGAQPVRPGSGATVSVNGRMYEATATVARDQSPHLLPSLAKGIGAHVRLRADDGGALPDLQPVCLRVALASETWQTKLDEAPVARGTDQSGRATFDAGAGDGPTWAPGTSVTTTAWLRFQGTLIAIEFGQVTVQAVE